MTRSAVGIAYLDGRRLARALMAAADWVDAGREELNRINVFPVPDGDTGTNFASTLRAVATAVARVPDRALRVVGRTMADACIVAARGNSGLLFSQFLIGIREGLGSRDTANVAEVAAAFQCGADRLRSALDVECLVAPVTAAIGVHAGPGAWGIFYQNEDGAANPGTIP